MSSNHDTHARVSELASSADREKALAILRYLERHSGAVFVGYDENVSDPSRREKVRRVQVEPGDEFTDVQEYLRLATELFYFGNQQQVIDSLGLPFPLYSVTDDYQLNSRNPLASPPLERPRVTGRAWTVFGKKIGFPIGVPASALTGSAEWISLLASSGFNVLTFKTVRSRATPAHAYPNWVILPDLRSPLTAKEALSRERSPLVGDTEAWNQPGNTNVSTANSFGVPSPSPEIWKQQVATAMTKLQSDQLLIVSVLGDDYGSGHRQDVIDDFVRVAGMAQEAGAGIIELNVSCPNSLDTGGESIKPPLCEEISLTTDIVRAVRSELLPATQIVLKLSYLATTKLQTLVSQVGPYVDGIAGINTLQSEVVDGTGKPLFGGTGSGPVRKLAGVSGVAIRDLALQFVRDLALARLETGNRFDILGMGGVTDPESFSALYEAGAKVVQSASGVFANPFLAKQCVDLLGETLEQSPYPKDRATQAKLEAAITQLVSSAGKPLDQYAIASRLAVPYAQTYETVARLLKNRKLQVDPHASLAQRYLLTK